MLQSFPEFGAEIIHFYHKNWLESLYGQKKKQDDMLFLHSIVEKHPSQHVFSVSSKGIKAELVAA